MGASDPLILMSEDAYAYDKALDGDLSTYAQLEEKKTRSDNLGLIGHFSWDLSVIWGGISQHCIIQTTLIDISADM